MPRWLWLSAAVVALDQLSKFMAQAWLTLNQPLPLLPSLNLTLAYNTGAAFSLLAGADRRWLLFTLAAAVSVVLLVWLLRLQRDQRWLAAALALVLGGAVGNLIDRALLGYVVDFVDVYHPALGGWPGFSANGHWPIFNVADAAISAGAVMLVIDALFGGKTRDEAQTDRS